MNSINYLEKKIKYSSLKRDLINNQKLMIAIQMKMKLVLNILNLKIKQSKLKIKLMLRTDKVFVKRIHFQSHLLKE
jgi:hypothetical protein